MAAFEYRQAEEIRNAFFRQGVRYLFIGKSGALLLGYPDTTQTRIFFWRNRLKMARRPLRHCANFSSASRRNKPLRSNGAKILSN